MPSHLKTGRILAVSACALFLMNLSGCTTVKEYWEYYLGGIDENAREATGFEKIAEAKQHGGTIRVPQGLEDPKTDPTMDVPPISKKAMSYPVGDDLDIRAPVAPLRSDLGVHSQWSHGEAIVWFEQGGEHGVSSEADAWRLLGTVLKKMNIGTGKVSADQYSLTTAVRDFNEFGAPYTPADLNGGAMKYRQVYRIRIGRNQNGDLGIASTLIGSMTILPLSGKNIEDVLNPIEQERFAMGFSNAIIHVLDGSSDEGATSGNAAVVLGRDHNGNEALMVDAHYETVWAALRRMLPEYNWEIKEFSLSNGRLLVDVDDQDAELFHNKGVDSFALDEGEYTVRVGEEDSKTVITFYDKDGMPLKAGTVDRIYSGFAQALTRELSRSAGN